MNKYDNYQQYQEGKQKQLLEVNKQKQLQYFLTLKTQLESITHRKIVQKIFLNQFSFRLTLNSDNFPDIFPYLDTVFSKVPNITYLILDFSQIDDSQKDQSVNITFEILKNLKKLKVLKIISYKFRKLGFRDMCSTIKSLNKDIKIYLDCKFQPYLPDLPNENYLQEGFDVLKDMRNFNNLKISLFQHNYIFFPSVLLDNITNGIGQLRQLKELKIDVSHVNKKSSNNVVQQICKTVENLKNIKRFGISFKIDQNGQYVLELLKKYQNLEGFQVHITGLNEENSIKFLSEGLLQLNSLKDLDISLNQIQINTLDVMMLSDALEKMKKVEKFRLKLCQTNLNEEAYLFLGLGVGKLQKLLCLELDLSKNGLKSENLRSIFEELQELDSLKELRLILKENQLCCGDCEHFQEFFRQINQVRYFGLDLGQNNIQSEGVVQLGSVIGDMKQVQQLNICLQGNNYFQQAEEDFLNVIKKQLVNCCLYYNEII